MAGFPLELPSGATRRVRRTVGRGRGTGLGKTCGRGHKGQKSRSGGLVRPGFEGGQMPLYRRLPKRGFSNARFAQRVDRVTLGQLARHYAEGDEVTLASLKERGLVSRRARKVKVLAGGELSFALRCVGVLLSASASEQLSRAGGQVSGGGH